jgi:hypothetical protein
MRITTARAINCTRRFPAPRGAKHNHRQAIAIASRAHATLSSNSMISESILQQRVSEGKTTLFLVFRRMRIELGSSVMENGQSS